VGELARGGKVLPLFVDALRVTEAVRRAALQLHGEPSEVLAGKDAEGQPLHDQHRHAHYVADCRGPVGRVSHVLVWAPAGLSATEQDALARLHFLHAGERGFSGEERARGDDPRSVDVVPMGFGQAADFAGASRLFMRARRWRSRTPFVLPRHPKRGREGADEQLVRELATRGFPRPETVRRVDGAALRDPLAGKASLTRWVEFEVRRRNRRPTTPLVGFELFFAEPQQGPILLGWGSHYGLGAFEAV
jgi:CRISPR-associated protein Csb2